MRITTVSPPRIFRVGDKRRIEMKDCARLDLDRDEQVTFRTERGAEYDVARKSWGFYATPSLNQRLPQFGLRAALVRGSDGKAFVMLVERECQQEFAEYLDRERLRVLAWLDDDRSLDTIARASDAADR